jgi:hypothetical protein
MRYATAVIFPEVPDALRVLARQPDNQRHHAPSPPFRSGSAAARPPETQFRVRRFYLWALTIDWPGSVIIRIFRPALRQGRLGPADARGDICGEVRGLGDRLPGREAERFGVGPAVVLGQDVAEVSRPVRHGAVAGLAARHRKVGNGHGEAAGM